MSRNNLTLAALVVSALPDVSIVESVMLSPAESNYRTALLTDELGRHFIIKVPKRQSAEALQSAELVALNALSDGVRSHLPFQVPQIVGQVPYGPTRAIITEYLYGQPLSGPVLETNASLAKHLGQALSALHNLPTSVVSTAGLIQYGAQEVRKQTLRIIDRAANSGHVPALLEERWRRTVNDDRVWQFSPTVIHSNMSADRFLFIDDQISAIRSWQGLKVADPALDLFWILSIVSPDTAQFVLDAYQNSRDMNLDAQTRKRAALYAELELARWLLHGIDLRDEAIIDDAVSLLHALLERVHNDLQNPLTDNELPSLDEGQVTEFLREDPAQVAREFFESDDAAEAQAYGDEDFPKTQYLDEDLR